MEMHACDVKTPFSNKSVEEGQLSSQRSSFPYVSSFNGRKEVFLSVFCLKTDYSIKELLIYASLVEVFF